MTVRRAIHATLIALAASAVAAAPSALAANVALFNDPNYVPVAEAGNVQLSLVNGGHGVFAFTDRSPEGFRAALDGRDVLVIPEQQTAALNPDLTDAAREVIRQFVVNGGGLVVHGIANDRAAGLVNSVFRDLALTESAIAGDTTRQPGAAGTEFAGTPETLMNNSEVTGIDAASLPADAKAIYSLDASHSVAVLPRGLGSVTYLGWDWNNSNPPNGGGQDGGWQAVLGAAVARPALAVNDVSVTEGDAGLSVARFTVRIGGPVSEEVRVAFNTVDGTAKSGQDYGAVGGVAAIARGQTETTVDVPVVGDGGDEENESFELKLSAPIAATLPDDTAIATIADDDPSAGRCANRRDVNDPVGQTLNGTPFGDLLVGLEGKDILNGEAGEDCLRGRAGNDRLNGGDDGDSLSGEAGNDRLTGAEGADTLSGGNGNDTMSGGNGNDRLGGGRGNDRINGGQGLNSYSGGSGNDNIVAANGRRETIDCGAGRRDRVRADRQDTVRNCENVSRL